MDFAKDNISTLFKKIFFPTLFGMLSVSAGTFYGEKYQLKKAKQFDL